MKIRIGFVSNSSSSSFVAVVPMKIHEKVLARTHPYVRAVVEVLGREKMVFGGKCFVTSTYSNQGYGTWDHIDIDYLYDNVLHVPYVPYAGDEENEEMDPYYAYKEIYLPAVEKEGEIFTHSISY